MRLPGTRSNPQLTSGQGVPCVRRHQRGAAGTVRCSSNLCIRVSTPAGMKSLSNRDLLIVCHKTSSIGGALPCAALRRTGVPPKSPAQLLSHRGSPPPSSAIMPPSQPRIQPAAVPSPSPERCQQCSSLPPDALLERGSSGPCRRTTSQHPFGHPGTRHQNRCSTQPSDPAFRQSSSEAQPRASISHARNQTVTLSDRPPPDPTPRGTEKIRPSPLHERGGDHSTSAIATDPHKKLLPCRTPTGSASGFPQHHVNIGSPRSIASLYLLSQSNSAVHPQRFTQIILGQPPMASFIRVPYPSHQARWNPEQYQSSQILAYRQRK
jgi:hypothetical protein